VAKTYRVELSQAAKIDIDSIRNHIAADNPAAAERWRLEIRALILRLETLPFAFEVIPEAAELGVRCRHKLFGNYRIVYRVDEDRVLIVRVIHGAQLLDRATFEWTPHFDG
jgi:plasmid stabilization system protein ParE